MENEIFIDAEGMELYNWQIILHNKPELICKGQLNIESCNQMKKTELCCNPFHKTHQDCMHRLFTHWKSKPEKQYAVNKDEETGCKFAEFMNIIVKNRRKTGTLEELKIFLNENIEIIKYLDSRHLHCIITSFMNLSTDDNEQAICAAITSFHFYQKFTNFFEGNNEIKVGTGYMFKGGEFFRKQLPYIINVIKKNDLLHRIFCSVNAWNVIYPNTVLNKIAKILIKQKQFREWRAFKLLFDYY